MVLVPLVIGMAVLRLAPSWAERLHVPVKAVAGLAAVALLVLCGIVYGPAMAATFGQRAIAAQVLFLGLVTAAAYRLGGGLPQLRRSVLALGLCTRNLGAALAPLLGAAVPDRQAVVMVVLGLPIQIVVALMAAAWFARDARAAAPPRGGA